MKLSTIEKAMETEEMEQNLALAWHEGYYTEKQTEWWAEERGLNFINVTLKRSRLLEVNNYEH